MQRPKNTRLMALIAALAVVLVALVCGVGQLVRTSEASQGVTAVDRQFACDVAPDASEGSAQVAGLAGELSDGGAMGVPDAPVGSAEDQVFVMPEDARYEPQTVVVTLPDGMTDTELQEAIATIPDARVTQGEDGLVLLEVGESVTVEEAVNQLLSTGAFDEVQPNYLYTAFEEDGVAALEEALDAHEAEPWVQTGDADSDDVPTGDVPTDDVPSDDAPTDDAPSDEEPTDEEPSDGGDATDDPSELLERLEVNDPLAPAQYNLDAVRAYEAWAVSCAEHDVNGSPVTVGVIDTGFYANHEDLADNVALTYNAVTGSTNVENGSAYTPHGTHVAGVLAARANNAIGVAGVSHNARMALVLVANASGEASSYTIAHSYDYLLARRDELNLRVINVSLGAPYKRNNYHAQDKLVMKSVDEAYANGVVTVAAAGNRSNSVVIPSAMFPCDLAQVVGVINVNQRRERTATSNYNMPGEGDKNISAPGDAILSTNSAASIYTYGDITYSGYRVNGGTSFAAPCVSAILALEFAANPSLSAEDAINILYGTADDVGNEGWDEQTGYGEVSAYGAVKAATGPKIAGPQSVLVGDKTVTFALQGDAEGSWRFGSSDPQVLSVNAETGLAEAQAIGTVTITATSDEGVSLAKVVRVFGEISGDATVGCGTTSTYVVESASVMQTWTWSSSDVTVATIGANSGLLTPVHAGTVTITATSLADPTFSVSKVIEVTGALGQAMLRLYNPNSGEHFYTASKVECDTLVSLGWTYEGIGWYAPDQSTTPVYRLYNPNVGDHHYTLDARERNALVSYGWEYEGIGWCSDDVCSVPVRREYNPNAFAWNHNFTTSQVEHDTLVRLGWTDEGIGWYALEVGEAA